MRLALLHAGSGSLQTWAPPVTGAYTGVWSLDIDTVGRLHIAGSFSAVAGDVRQCYARFSPY